MLSGQASTPLVVLVNDFQKGYIGVESSSYLSVFGKLLASLIGDIFKCND